MDNKALFNLTYGVFMVATKSDDQLNGCIINTCMQVANNPVRVAISILNTNYTCELIKKSNVFALSILDQSVTFETIKHFGYQSGRNVSKFGDIKTPTDENGVPYLGWQTCAMISCKVVKKVDLDTHTMFVAEVVDAKVLSDEEPLTYADYQNKIKPKQGNQGGEAAKPQETTSSQKVSSSENTTQSSTQKNRKIIGWRCVICNYVYEGSELPANYVCPLCGHGPDDFEPIYEE